MRWQASSAWSLWPRGKRYFGTSSALRTRAAIGSGVARTLVINCCACSPGDRIDLQAELLRVGEEFRILHGGVEGAAQRLYAILRNARRHEIRPAVFQPRDEQLERRTVGIVLRKVEHHRNVRKIGMLLERPLRDHVDFLFLHPIAVERQQRRPVGRTVAVDLAAFHREMDVLRAFVAGDDLEFVVEHRVGEHRVVVLRGAGRLRAGHHFGVGDVGERLHRRGVPHIGHLRFAVGAAEPHHLHRIEAHARRLKQRRRRQAVERCADRGAVERAVGDELVHHGHAAGAGLVLHDDGGIAGDVFAPVPLQRAGSDVVTGTY